MNLALGPFELLGPAGRGGMAEVWRGRHRGRGVDVAIKVVTAGRGTDPRYRAWFAQEVRAVAQLDHPAVVRVYDHGAIGAEQAEASGGRLPAGAPYLVMEWLDGGPVDRGSAASGFGPLRTTLLALLDGLAHAHARGMVHRDIKPENVLRGPNGPVLTDFGLAFDPQRHASDRVAGTPGFMPPEQIKNDWRAFGPWTDLYAVGCLAWLLATGAPPFHEHATPSHLSLLMAHLDRPLPPLESRVPVPAGFEAWLRRLLAKDPAARFAFAADAAFALASLDVTEGEEALAPTQEHALAPADTVVSDPALLDSAECPDTIGATPAPADRPPLPADWAPADAAAPPFLPEVGRALFSFRALPPVGRGPARDALWAALREVHRGAGARLVLVEGASGLGKTHLARWLLHRAHEVGAADWLAATHEDPPGPTCGLAPMLGRALHTDGLEGRALTARLAAALGAEDETLPIAVAALLQPDHRVALGDATVWLRTPAERHAILCRALARMTAGRACIVLLDDVQWGAETLDFAAHLLDRRAELPVLLLATLRSDALRRGSEAATRVEALAARREVRHLRLAPLSPADHGALVRAMLPLAPPLVAALVERSEGSPLFAAELVRHWIGRDLLEPGPAGFRLRADAGEGLPVSTAGIWRLRLAEAVTGLPTDAEAALEIAAVLGLTFDQGEWASACAEAGLAPDLLAAATERLLDEGLLQRGPDGHLAFAHAMLRDMLHALARARGRWRPWHACCAVALAGREAEPTRLVEHRLEAGDWHGALEVLYPALQTHFDRSTFGALRRLLLRGLAALRALGVPRRDARWVRLRVWWANLCYQESGNPAALRHARRAADAARALGEPALQASALFTLASAQYHAGGATAGLATLRAAAEQARAAGDWREQVKILSDLGGTLAIAGQAEEAEAALDEALACLGGHDHPGGEGAVHYYRAYLAAYLGRDADAIPHAQAARQCFLRAGRWQNAAITWSLEGDARRRQGDAAGAEACYRAYGRAMVVVGPRERAYLSLNLGLTLLGDGRVEAAAVELERAAREQARGPADMIAAARLVVAAYAGDWAGWDALAASLTSAVEGTSLDPDIPWCAERAAWAADAAGQPERAAFARRLAITQYEALGRHAAAAALRE